MTQAQARQPGSAAPTGHSTVHSNAWAGWVFFAGIMMVMLGAFQVIAGLVALFDDGYYLVARNGLVLSLDFTAWGWIHLILGIVAFVAGYAVMVGRTWGRVVGIVLAVLSAIANMAFVAAYPVWAAIIITVDVIVIYALAVHGREADVNTARGTR